MSDPDWLLAQAHPHRGALNNLPNRFAKHHSEREDDGWQLLVADSHPHTQVQQERVKTILSHNDSPDLPFHTTLNPYRGCEHGCIYCFARPSHAYWDLSPGLDFETRLIAKSNAVEVLKNTLQDPKYQVEPLALGANTDAYQPLESRLQTTRQLLEVLLDYRHPVGLVTKGALILRDLSLWQALAAQELASVRISLTTLDEDLRQRLEPRAATVSARLKVIERLSQAGVPVGVMLAPVIPALNEHELEQLLAAAANAGAKWAGYILLRLPLEVAPLFRDWLQQHYPQRAQHVMSLVQQSRDGKDYDARFGQRMRGQGKFAELLAQRFRLACKRYGLNEQAAPPLRTDLFQPPNQQFSLF
ncbi:PA0069 family radical SAM protein [Balneatrix alpica]|uniref:PA0069 family radical SAM protein n=1 Tax=Balneatrix alpica TaxID=75684 RepID=A0ABV5ZBZ2_9GAMM|nr:PA0069 family radical SAM protein [Balneatrix alpica]